jgi:hypothetical protein
MLRIYRTHLTSLAFVGFLFLLIYVLFSGGDTGKTYHFEKEIKQFMQLDFLDLSSPEDLALLHESLNIYDPDHLAKNDSLIAEIKLYLHDQMQIKLGPQDRAEVAGNTKLSQILLMLGEFALIYLLVLLVTYYGVETFGIYKFFRIQQGGSFLAQLRRSSRHVVSADSWIEKTRYLAVLAGRLSRGILKGILYLALFAPAYVIAYSFKTRFESGTLLIMILLAVISNGLLITYTQKYFTYLVQESRKGYVQTAIVKSLRQDYRFNRETGIPLTALFRIRKRFPGHIFDQIYENVRFQYLQTLKEQASYLISGLIIIEMALNIQGHLCYELMQQILYMNLPLILFILFGIFLIVKLTEIIIDLLVLSQQRRLDGAASGGAG